jgi:hypothetical protein
MLQLHERGIGDRPVEDGPHTLDGPGEKSLSRSFAL